VSSHMNFQLAGKAERLYTMITIISFLCCVISHMHFKLAAQAKRLCTQATCVVLFFFNRFCDHMFLMAIRWVSFHMILKATGEGEVFRTKQANIRLFPTMPFQMICQVTRPTKWLFTDRAAKRPFPSMSSQMLLQIGHIGKGFWANITLVCLLSFRNSFRSENSMTFCNNDKIPIYFIDSEIGSAQYESNR